MTDLKDVTQCKSGHGEFGVEAGTRDPLACWRAGSGGLETGVHLSRHHSRTRLSISSEPWNPVFSVVLPASIRGRPGESNLGDGQFTDLRGSQLEDACLPPAIPLSLPLCKSCLDGASGESPKITFPQIRDIPFPR